MARPFRTISYSRPTAPRLLRSVAPRRAPSSTPFLDSIRGRARPLFYGLVIHVAFESRVADVTTAEFEATAIAILTDPGGWVQSGFAFVADPDSGLRIVLAEGPEVDELCLPLDTSGRVSCQNGSVVALNADRWKAAFRDWDSTVEAYRVYLVTHEVGHLIGLRHPAGRCPEGEPVSAVMEPQTNNLVSCAGNGTPLPWEIEWAKNRPAVVGPTPDWDGPRPKWPTGDPA